MRLFIIILHLVVAVSGAAAQPLGTHHYFYVSDQRIITVELIDARKAILNYISLGTTFEFLEAPLLLIEDAAGKSYRGHLIEIEGEDDPAQRLKVSELMKPGQYAGYTILGRFDFESPPLKTFFRVGSRIFELEAVTSEDFELVAARIGELDLDLESGKQMVLMAGFRSGHGILHSVGSAIALELEPRFPDLELISPVLLAAPRPRLPVAFMELEDPVVVRLKAFVSTSGGVHNVEVVEGIDSELDRMAVQTVTESWDFLPGISKGDLANMELTLNVVFRRE